MQMIYKIIPLTAGEFVVYDNKCVLMKFVVKEGEQYPKNWKELVDAHKIGMECEMFVHGEFRIIGGECDVLYK